MNLKRTLLPLILLLLLAGSARADQPRILAFVGTDTLTTTDLKIELNIMRRKGEDKATPVLPDPDQVLRRLIQNRLIVQEGYRMGLNEEFAVQNQVDEAVNARCMGALLDSVALAVPTDTPDLHTARRLAVKNYIDDLKVMHGVKVDTTLLRSLDYASSDSQVQDYLRDSEDILAEVPTGTLTVAGFSRIVRFTAFHGLEGKPDASERRDEIFHEWVAETVTIHEARRRDIRQRPTIQLYERRLERALMLEETLNILLQLDFDPTEQEIEAFYQEHLSDYMSEAKVKMESLKFSTEEDALQARDRLIKGAAMKWIKSNMDGVIQGPDPFPADFFAAGKLGLKPENAVVGHIPDPYGVPGGWVLARISEVRESAPIPLADCRDKLLRHMKSDATNSHMREIVTVLEEAVPVEIKPDAEAIVAEILAAQQGAE